MASPVQVIDVLQYFFIPILVVSVLLYTKKYSKILVYLLLYVATILIVYCIKYIVKEERPDKDETSQGDTEKKIRKIFPVENYGMPSLGLAIFGYSFVFLYFLFPKNIYIFLLFIIVGIKTLQDRLMHHTPLQIFMGLITGFILGYVYTFTHFYSK